MYAIIDCNSFYCGCERLFMPHLHNKPVVVLSNNDGCIVSRTDEAKALHIDMAVPYYQCKEEIEKNNVAVFSSNYNLYGDLSKRVMDTMRTIVGDANVEVYSVDEAFVNLHIVPIEKLYEVAKELKDTIELWTGIKVSIGVAPTKVLCKIANRLSKKDKIGTQGVVILDTEEKIIAALLKTPVGDVWGVGRRSNYKLKEMYHVYNAYDLSKMKEDWARKNLGGVVGVRLIKELNSDPCIGMKDPLEKKKMIATTRMFGKPVYTLPEIKEALATYISRAAEKLRRQYSAAKTIQAFVVTNDNDTNKYDYKPASRYRHIELPIATSNTAELIHHTMPLAEQLFVQGLKYLKAGVILMDIVPDASIQGNLFMPEAKNSQRKLMQTIDNINFGMNEDAIKFIATGLKRNWKMRQELRSKRYTTRWNELYEIS
jgi:DNA polymerase V